MNLSKLSPYRLGFLITLATAMAYGAWPSAMRAAYADGANSTYVIVLATIGRALPLFIACLLQRKPLFQTKSDRRNALTGGFFQAISSSTALAAVMFLQGPLVVVIMFTHTLMLLGYMIWRREVKPDAATLLTTSSALFGLCFVLDIFHKQSGDSLIGMGLAFVSSVAIASRLYVYGHQMKTREPAVVGAENFLVAIAFTLVVLFHHTPEGPHTAAGFWWILLGIASLAGGTFGQFYAIRLLGSFRYSLFLKLEPMFSTIFAALLIGEYLKWSQYFGVLMVIGSLFLYQLADRRHSKNNDKILNAPGE